jgi:hypothetical protein
MRTIYKQKSKTVDDLRKYTRNGKRNPFEEYGEQGLEFRKGLMEILLGCEVMRYQATYIDYIDMIYRFAEINGIDVKQAPEIRQRNVLNWLANGEY